MSASAPSFVEFQRVVIDDAAMFSRLQAVSEPDAFAALAVQLGRERGFAFTPDDVAAALQAARRDWIERHIR